MLNQYIHEALETQGIAWDETQANQWEYYLKLLLQWNQTYSLTSITEIEKMVSHHLIDSLSILPYIAEDPLLDFGTGAGLPGIPLAIARPDQSISLVDSNAKKTRFLKHVKRSMPLNNVRIYAQRVESLEHQFDQIVCRAVGSLTGLWSLVQCCLSDSGVLWAMKGRVPKDELNDLRTENVSVDVFELQVPKALGERCLIRMMYRDNQKTT